MIRSLATILLVASGWSWADLSLDRVRWNERERSAAGIENLDAGRDQDAIEAFETAARLDAEDPLLRFNAGSAHLAAGSEGALVHLEAAAGLASEDLGAPTNYNLGNARLAADDAAGAIEAYEQALRLAPANEDAKFNLELALRRQQEQQEQEQEQQEQGGESSDQNDEKSDQEQQPGDHGQESGEQPPEEPDQPEPQEPDQQQPGSQDGESESEGTGERDRPMPQFEDQPDMTAEQAAAILEAVENLEREQRRLQAAEEMKKRPRKGKDW